MPNEVTMKDVKVYRNIGTYMTHRFKESPLLEASVIIADDDTPVGPVHDMLRQSLHDIVIRIADAPDDERAMLVKFADKKKTVEYLFLSGSVETPGSNGVRIDFDILVDGAQILLVHDHDSANEPHWLTIPDERHVSHRRRRPVSEALVAKIRDQEASVA